MSTRTTWLIIGLLCALYLAGMTASIVLAAANGTLFVGATDPALAVAFLAFMVVGVAIVAHRPGHGLGMLFCGVGLLAAVLGLAMEYAVYALVTRPGEVPGGVAAAWFASWTWYPLIGSVTVYTPLLFPTGHLPTPRWRWVAWAAAAFTAALSVTAAFAPTLATQQIPPVEIANPLGIAGMPTGEGGALGAVLLPLGGVAFVAAALSPVLRFRRATGDERQQLKWFALAAAVVSLVLLLEEVGAFPGIAFGLVLALLPIAVGVAVLRYGLYAIDRVVSRAVTYAVITALLGALYVLGVMLLGLLFRPFAPSSELAVAGSTLAVAAAFRPVRRRVQTTVDRRFNRARYDARLTVEAFRGRMRDEVDLGQLSAELLAAVRESVEPSRAVVWLRRAPDEVAG